MQQQRVNRWVAALLVVASCSACQQEPTTEKAGAASAQPSGTIEHAIQQSVDGIKGPMDKARGVEGTLERGAERIEEQVQGQNP